MTWIKKDLFWRRSDEHSVPGDLIFNNLTKIVMDGDGSEWAIDSFLACAKLLQGPNRKRWPDEFNIGTEAPNRWVFYPYMYWKKLWRVPHREWKWQNCQTDMTRDPYWAFGACFIHLMTSIPPHYDLALEKVYQAFIKTTIPWYILIHNFSMIVWRKRLIKDNRDQWKRRLDYFGDYASMKCFELKYEDDFYKN